MRNTLPINLRTRFAVVMSRDLLLAGPGRAGPSLQLLSAASAAHVVNDPIRLVVYTGTHSVRLSAVRPACDQ